MPKKQTNVDREGSEKSRELYPARRGQPMKRLNPEHALLFLTVTGSTRAIKSEFVWLDKRRSSWSIRLVPYIVHFTFGRKRERLVQHPSNRARANPYFTPRRENISQQTIGVVASTGYVVDKHRISRVALCRRGRGRRIQPTFRPCQFKHVVLSVALEVPPPYFHWCNSVGPYLACR